MKERFMSLILSASMLISPSYVFAEDSVTYENTSKSISEPTPEPMTQDLRDWQQQVEKNNSESLEAASAYTERTTPEPMKKYTLEDVPYLLKQEYFIDWSDTDKMKQIINGISGDNPEIVSFIDDYYLNSIDADSEVILSEFFTEEELNTLILTHPYRMSDHMKKLLAIFIKEDSISNNIKSDVIRMIKNGLTINEALEAYLLCIPALDQLTYASDIIFDNEELTEEAEIETDIADEALLDEETENVEFSDEGIVSETEHLTDDALNVTEETADVLNSEDTIDISPEETLENNELYKLAEANGFLQAAALSSDTLTKKEIWQNSLLENKYYQGDTELMQVEGKMGGASIRRNDISVPLKDGINLECPIQYNSNDAYALTFGREYFNVNSWCGPIQYRVNNPISPLGVGWSWGMTNMRNGVITLEDGRSFSIDERTKTKQGSKYPDVTFNYDSANNVYYIAYLDGRKEYLSELSFDIHRKYIDKKEDKYGDCIYYTYDTNDSEKLLFIENDYNSDIYIEVKYDGDEINKYVCMELPNKSHIVYLITNINLNYGSIIKAETETVQVPVLSAVEFDDLYDDSTNSYNNAGSICYYEYQSFECFYIDEVQTISGAYSAYSSDGRAYALVSSITDLSNGIKRKYTHEKSPVYNFCSFPAVKTISDGNDLLIKSYTRKFSWHVNNKDNKTETTVIYSDGLREKNTYDERISYNNKWCVKNTYTTAAVFASRVTELKKETLAEEIYPYKIIYSIDTTTYGRAIGINIPNNITGQTITRRVDYEYNSFDKPTKITETLDGEVKGITENTYSNNKYCSLSGTIYKNGSGNTLYRINYMVNIYGEVVDETTNSNNSQILKEICYGYDSDHNLSYIEYYTLDGSLYLYEYDYTNNMRTREYVSQNGNIIAEKKMSYDPDTNKLVSTTDGNGNTEEYSFGIFGEMYSQTHSDSSKLTNEYDYYFAKYTTTAENGYKTTSILHNGAVSKVTENNTDVLISAEIDEYGRTVKTTDAEGNVTNIFYDQFGRQREIRNPSINGTASDYNVYYYDVFTDGNNKCSLVITVNPENKLSCKYYDIRGRLVKTAVISDPGELLEDYNIEFISEMPSYVELVVTSTIEYNDLDQAVKVTDGEGRETKYTYDVLGNVLSVSQGSGTEELYVEYTYDALRNVKKMSQGKTNPHVTVYEHDTAGRLVKTTDPMGFTEENTYDKAGNLICFKDKNGDITTNTYDERNRLISTSKGGKSISYTYDSVGNLLTSSDESGTIKYEYNLDSTLKKKTMPDNKSITYTKYDKNKRLTSMTDYFGNATAYTYDAHGNIASIGEKYKGSTAYKNTTYTYNQDDTLSKVNIPNNMTVQYTYDYAGRVIKLKNSSPYMNSYSDHLYKYDNSNNIISSMETMFGQNMITTVYEYDSVNRLIEESGVAGFKYQYDEYNNLCSAIGDSSESRDIFYSYDKNNRLCKIEDLFTKGETADGERWDDWQIDFTYDNNGKLLSSSKNSAPNCYGYTSNHKTYTYNVWGQLTGFSDSLGDSAEYTYYSDGLRSSRKVGSTTYKYYYNGDKVVNETKNGSNFATNVYGVDGPISRQYSGLEHYYYKNVHGDVIFAFTSNHWRSSEYSYAAYGEEDTSYDYYSSNPNPLRYSGEYLDTESGMTYLRARYYDPYQRRFISEDPAKDGLNWYAYCGNNPVSFIDLKGLHRQPINETINDQTVTTAEREDLRTLLKQFNGVLKIENNIIKIKALGGYGEINIDSMNDGIHLINDHIHFSYGEFFDILGITYEKTTLTVQVTKEDENRNRIMYSLKESGIDLVGTAISAPIESVWGGFETIFGFLTGFINDVTVDTSSAPPVIPEGTYQINQYTINGKCVLQQQIGVSSGNNYYDTEFLSWNPENESYPWETLLYGWSIP